MSHTGYVDVHFFINVKIEKDSRVYTGEVLIAGQDLFEFEMEPTFSLRRYRQVLSGVTPEQIRELLRITIRKDGVEVPLDFSEYEVFFGLLFGQVYHLYKEIKSAKRAGLYMGDRAVSEGEGDLALSPLVCRVLTGPKFGCILLDTNTEQGVLVS